MSYRLIAEEKPHHAVSRLARVLGVSAGFYAWQRRPPSERARSDVALTKRIQAIHDETDGIYGAPRIHAELAGLAPFAISKPRPRLHRLQVFLPATPWQPQAVPTASLRDLRYT